MFRISLVMRFFRKRATIKNDRKLIYFSRQLPFQPDKMQIIYIEDHPNLDINENLHKHYAEISELIIQKGYRLFYEPEWQRMLNEPEFQHYNFPGVNPAKIEIQSIPGNQILNCLHHESIINCGFIRFKMAEYDRYVFSYFELNDNLPIIGQVQEYLSLIGDDSIKFSLGNPEGDDDVADFNFYQQSKHLMEEVQERILKLKLMGVEEILIRNLIDLKPPTSTLKIGKDFSIYLPEYQKEIRMAPLPKAVFLLFLKHPDGILFKHLPDYRDELLSIYLLLAQSDDRVKSVKSITDLTDPSNNSINEKCSRIREAFLREINDELARLYYITGNRSEPKKIVLNRDLVVWEEGD